MTNPELQQAQIEQVSGEEGEVIFRCLGDWTVENLDSTVEKLEVYSKTFTGRTLLWDVSEIEQIDPAGIMLFIYYHDLFKARQCSVELVGASPGYEELYRLIRPLAAGHTVTKPGVSSRLLQPLKRLGKNSTGFCRDVLEFLSFIGENFVSLVISLRHPASIRYSAIVKNIEDAGVRALPIITLTSFLIGIVIAYQGAVQLQKFGANIFIVDMIAISITRELAPLITAIVVAGRTGSSYTAQLGAMKITEEINAMRTMGFDPHQFLVLPRIIALMIALPLMIFFADIIGIGGGMVVANLHLNISYTEFIHRLQDVLDIKHLWIGLIKGPFFAWLIAITGCFRGFQVSRNTESIGRYTTISVVNAIFLVIACDAIFSVILTELGI